MTSNVGSYVVVSGLHGYPYIQLESHHKTMRYDNNLRRWWYGRFVSTTIAYDKKK